MNGHKSSDEPLELADENGVAVSAEALRQVHLHFSAKKIIFLSSDKNTKITDEDLAQILAGGVLDSETWPGVQ